MKTNVAAIILAGGNGIRMKSVHINKVVIPFMGKPMIRYGVELFKGVAYPVIVVIGAFAESVRNALSDYHVIFVRQKERLGTGHATQVGLHPLQSNPPSCVLVGYGDHLMFYKKDTIQKFIIEHTKHKADISLMTTKSTHPDALAWGRIIRDDCNTIIGCIEQKDATLKEKKIEEVNPGFYCFNYQFLVDNIHKLTNENAVKEYYLTDMVKIAAGAKKKIVGFEVPFEEVGIGVNKLEQLEKSQRLYRNTKS